MGKKAALWILLVLAGCATPPTEAELAALNYGACPRTHESKIKEYFQGTLFTGYAGDPIIWPPKQYWYKETPVDGGRFLSGYLVPVRVEQTRGPIPTAGHQLYGFLFKDDQVVKTFPPFHMRTLTIQEDVGPLPDDGRGWKVGHEASRGNSRIIEWVLPGETVQAWSELISVQMIRGFSPEMTPAKIFELDSGMKRKGCADASGRVVAQSQTELLYEWKLSKCAPMRDEYLIGKFILGPRAMTHVWYAKTAPMSAAETKKWTDIVAKTKIFSDCVAN